jgi:hypothetical protein
MLPPLASTSAVNMEPSAGLVFLSNPQRSADPKLDPPQVWAIGADQRSRPMK